MSAYDFCVSRVEETSGEAAGYFFESISPIKDLMSLI
jgi:hypothetical protein